MANYDDMVIPHIWNEIHQLWCQWYVMPDKDKTSRHVLEVDPFNLKEMQIDHNNWMSNVDMIAMDGSPCSRFRGFFEIRAFSHTELLPPSSVRELTPEELNQPPFFKHLSLHFKGSHGRYVYLNWEGNHAPFNT